MNFVSVFMAFFSVLGALDRIIGNRFGLGKEFEKGMMLMGNVSLSMIGMIVISPFIAQILGPVFNFVRDVLHLDPSIIPASLFANDMGGASLAVQIAADEKIGMFNALVVSAMMGCTISFNIPYALGVVKSEHNNELFLGFLCGIVTIPIGCFVAGLVSGIPIVALLLNLLPLVIFSVLISVGLIFKPMLCVKLFSILGTFMKIIITIGLGLGILKFLTGIEIIPGLAPLEEGAAMCLNACVVLSGAFPLMYIISKLVSKPLKKLGAKLEISENAALGFVASLATNATTFEMMNTMDKKGIVMNAAFAISAAFTFASHLAFTMAFDIRFILPVIVGKLVAGFSALVVSAIVYKRSYQ